MVKQTSGRTAGALGILLLTVLLTAILIIGLAVRTDTKGEIDYRNSDATWHVLLTMQAYSETPVSEHLFLPIVTLGGDNNLNISWGASVPDKMGRYYYTSFSPAGFAAPWIFSRVFHIEDVKKGLLYFNCALFILSALLWEILLLIVYKDSKYKELLALLGGLGYVFAPEIAHNFTLVYWHQSLMQVLLLLQMISYLLYRSKGSKAWRGIFYAFCVINPYVEWTGYVANVGFGLAELSNTQDYGQKSERIKRLFLVAVLTMAAALLFVCHYLLRVNPNALLLALKARFMERNVTSSALLTDVFSGYLNSFLYLWVVLIVLLTWCFIRKHSLEIHNGWFILLLAFPILENVVMKEHAISYPYDRMKAIFLLIYLICEIAGNILESEKSTAGTAVLLIVLFLGAGCLNVQSYVEDERYVWQTDYETDNKAMAEYVCNTYPDALYCCSSEIRGYVTLLFHRNIVEGIELETAKRIASEKGKELIVYINKDSWSSKIEDIHVLDLNDPGFTLVSAEQGNVQADYLGEGYHTTNLTENKWVKGYDAESLKLLFDRDNDLLIKLLAGSTIRSGEESWNILDVEYGEDFIKVQVDHDAAQCSYPASITVE